MRHVFRDSLKSSWPLYLLVLAIFALGLICGALNVNFLPAAKVEALHDYIDAFFKQALGLHVDTSQVAWEAIYNKIIMMAALYILGLTIIGIPAILGLIFLRGFVLGFTVAFLSRDLAWLGLLLAAASIMPQNLLYLPALFIGAVAALSFALLLFPRSSSTWSKVWGAFFSLHCCDAGRTNRSRGGRAGGSLSCPLVG